MTKKTEYEVKVLDVDLNDLQQKLIKLKFQVVPRFKFTRQIYNLPDGAWIRLRSDGTKTTLTYKKSHTDSIDGVEEIEVGVADFKLMSDILDKANVKLSNYQENYRTQYSNGEIEVTIDEWPMIDPYVEIEGASVKDVEKYLTRLGLNNHKKTSLPTSHIYEENGINLEKIVRLQFDKQKNI